MSYEVGTYVDLSHLNKKSEAVQQVPRKSSAQEISDTLYEVGTQFVFNITQGHAKRARRIQVQFA